MTTKTRQEGVYADGGHGRPPYVVFVSMPHRPDSVVVGIDYPAEGKPRIDLEGGGRQWFVECPDRRFICLREQTGEVRGLRFHNTEDAERMAKEVGGSWRAA